MINDVVLRGYYHNKEVYAVRRTVSPKGNPRNIVIEVEASEKIRKEYQKQESKFTKRKDWKNDRGFY